MAHYVGPKGRVNRRLGLLIFENGGARRALERRDSPPGMHVRRKKQSNYGLAMAEKQKIKYFYGLGERQLRRMFAEASRTVGNTGEQLLILCERRLDNVVRRSGIASTRPQARQGIVHGHFLVNGHRVDKPSYSVRPGDVIVVRRKPAICSLYAAAASLAESRTPSWLSSSVEDLEIRVVTMPTADEVSLPVNASSVVELLSR
jgi:small subunit ribosomal protein S4